MKLKHDRLLLVRDIAIIIFSIILAVVLVKSDVLTRILTSTQQLELLGSFIAGMFFTTVFTTAPAIVTLGEIAKVSSIVSTAFFGAMGATLVDIIIFRFVRDSFSEHILELLRDKNGKMPKLKFLLKLKFFNWFPFLIGGLIIASPLPDELGISILGFSKMRMSRFIPFSFISNFVGIVVIGIVAKAIA